MGELIKTVIMLVIAELFLAKSISRVHKYIFQLQIKTCVKMMSVVANTGVYFNV